MMASSEQDGATTDRSTRKRKAPLPSPDKETDKPGDVNDKTDPSPSATMNPVPASTNDNVIMEEKKSVETTTTTAIITETSKQPTNPYDSIRHCIVENDGKHDSLVKLVGLKQLFAKQLPKMPRPYIARLVFDRRHKSLAILSDDFQQKGGDEEIIGGICYRGFPEMRLAEIAFCAVSASQQVKVCIMSVC